MGNSNMNGSMNMSAAFQQNKIQNRAREHSASHDVFTCHRVRAFELNSNWAPEVNERLAELTSLPTGWDGYAGQPVSFTCAYFVANMLERLCQENVPAPLLIPGSDGSLQVEWHRNMFDVELDVLDAQNVVATRVNNSTNQEEVIEIQNDFSDIVHWISDLAGEVDEIEAV